MKTMAPHSPEWFAIVQRTAPAFARTVRFTIQCEGSRDVCSVCGDAPVGDFLIIEAVVSTRGVPSIRLCDCCTSIREGVGETLKPMSNDTKDAAARLAEAGLASLGSFWKKIYLPRR